MACVSISIYGCCGPRETNTWRVCALISMVMHTEMGVLVVVLYAIERERECI